MEKNRIIRSFNLDAKSAPTRPRPPTASSQPAAVPPEQGKEGRG